MAQSVPAAAPRSAPGAAALSGLIGFIERRPQAAFSGFLALHFAVWTALPALFYANLPLDLIEALTYGREWQLGYDKLPPLPWWLVEIMYRAFGADAAYYALAQAAVVIAFALVFAAARPLVGTLGALVAVLIIDGFHYFQYTAVKFNHDVIQLPFWALAGYAFHAALKRGRLAYWLVLGVAFGGALWAKYFVVVLVAPYALFMLFDRQARQAFATPGPWLALATALLIAAPHVVWLLQTDFEPFAYASHRAAEARGWFDHVLHPAAFAVSQIFFALPALFIATALFWPRPMVASLPNAAQNLADAFDRRIVTVLVFGPGLTTIAFAAVSGRGPVAMWGYPLWLYLGLWLVLAAQTAIDGTRLRRIVGAWAAVFASFVVVFVANYSVLPYFDHRYRAVLFPGDMLGATLTQRFHAATGAPLHYVIGSMWDGGNLAHYSPDQPQVLIDGEPARAPWIDLNDLRNKGAIVLWTQGDSEAMPPQFAAIAPDAVIGPPFDLPMRRGDGAIHVGWAILKAR
ncbi:MAG: glycosyltransferase family 39 protein [Xanthobacteraceae bacterium]